MSERLPILRMMSASINALRIIPDAPITQSSRVWWTISIWSRRRAPRRQSAVPTRRGTHFTHAFDRSLVLTSTSAMKRIAFARRVSSAQKKAREPEAPAPAPETRRTSETEQNHLCRSKHIRIADRSAAVVLARTIEPPAFGLAMPIKTPFFSEPAGKLDRNRRMNRGSILLRVPRPCAPDAEWSSRWRADRMSAFDSDGRHRCDGTRNSQKMGAARSFDDYDPSFQPASEKKGVLIGMAMTEKQGGSDVRANTTRAEAIGNGEYVLNGHKWFCSAPMCDAFLVLAQAPGGLSWLFLPRWTPDGDAMRFTCRGEVKTRESVECVE